MYTLHYDTKRLCLLLSVAFHFANEFYSLRFLLAIKASF